MNQKFFIFASLLIFSVNTAYAGAAKSSLTKDRKPSQAEETTYSTEIEQRALNEALKNSCGCTEDAPIKGKIDCRPSSSGVTCTIACETRCDKKNCFEPVGLGSSGEFEASKDVYQKNYQAALARGCRKIKAFGDGLFGECPATCKAK